MSNFEDDDKKKALTPTKVSSLKSQNTKHKLSAGKQDNQGVSKFSYMVIVPYS